jgi:hypothetical protein
VEENIATEFVFRIQNKKKNKAVDRQPDPHSPA